MFSRNKVPFILGAIFVLLPVIVSLLNLYTDWLIFGETGFSGVFTTTLTAKIGAGVSVGGLLLLFTMANLFFAQRAKFPQSNVFRGAGNIYRLKRDEASQLVKPVGIMVCLVLALFAGQWGARQWESILLFTNAVPVGTLDPIIGKDISFYLFKLPLLEIFKGFAGFMVMAAMLLVAVVYYVRGGIMVNERGAMVDSKVRRHLAVLAGLFLLVIAGGFYLDGFQLLLSSGGTVSGAGYTDVNARLLTFRLLSAITPIAAIALVAGVWRGSWRLALAAPVIVFAVYGLGVKAYPVFLQKFKVAPNELALETPYIENNIKFTRFGYDLDKIETVPFDVDSEAFRCRHCQQ